MTMSVSIIFLTIAPVSAKKRMLLSGFGFLERVYNLLGSTATLMGPSEGNQLLIALRSAISALEKVHDGPTGFHVLPSDGGITFRT
jgi:hypothetical protein